MMADPTIKEIRVVLENGTETVLAPATSEFATVKEVAQMIGYSANQTYRNLQDPEKKQQMFPNAVKVGPADNSPWNVPISDVSAYLTRRLKRAVPETEVRAALTAIREGYEVPLLTEVESRRKRE